MRAGVFLILITLTTLSCPAFSEEVVEPVGVEPLEGPSPASIRLVDESEPVCVVTPKARLRIGPSTSSRVSWIVGQHMPLERLATKDGWSKVRDLRGQTHWVVSSALSATETCAVVRVRAAPLHEGPGAQEPRSEFRAADRYTAFKRVDRESGWVRLQDSYRGNYWTRENNLWIPVKKSRLSF